MISVYIWTILLILIAFGLAYGLGLVVVNVVDARLDAISINMPKVVIQLPGGKQFLYNSQPDLVGGYTSLNFYKSPDQMTPEQRTKFKLRGKFAKMTPLDYGNWLTLYQGQVIQLSMLNPIHLEFYKKFVILQQPITDVDLARVRTAIVVSPQIDDTNIVQPTAESATSVPNDTDGPLEETVTPFKQSYNPSDDQGEYAETMAAYPRGT
jgi:hypothetical protein